MARLDLDITNTYFRSGRIYIGTTPTTIGSPALTNRKFLTILNAGTANIYVGSTDVGVTGFPYYPGYSDTLKVGPSVKVKGFAVSGSVDIRFQEGS